MKIIKSLARILISVYLLMTLLIYTFQRDYIYYPSLKYQHGLTIEQFSNEGEQIEVVVLNEGKENAILYFGGNGESVVHNSAGFAEVFADYTVYLVNYRGYAGSSGTPSEKALYSDGHVIFDTLEKRHDTVSLIGRSLGSGVASFIASTRIVKKLVLITPFDSIEQIAKDAFPFYPISYLLQDKYDSVSRIKDIESQTLVILAEHDEIIPLKNSVRLIDAFPMQQVTVKTVLAAGHNDLSSKGDYFVFLQSFMSTP